MRKVSKFRLPRKKKKQFKKDDFLFKLHYNKECWEWFYFKRRIEVRCMEVILKYPAKANDDELLEYYKKHYPNDKLAHHYCRQNRHKWDKFNSNSLTMLKK